MDKIKILEECKRLENDISNLTEKLKVLQLEMNQDEEFSYHYDDQEQMWCVQYAKDHVRLEYTQIGDYLVRTELQVSGITVKVDKKVNGL